MMKLAMYQARMMLKKLIWLIVAVIASFCLYRLSLWEFQGITYVSSIGTLFLLLTFLMAMVCVAYMVFQSWMGVENMFYSPTAYLMRTLPLSRMKLFGAYLLSTTFVWLVLFALGVLLFWLVVPEAFSTPLPEEVHKALWMIAAACILQGALYWGSGVFAIVFGHFKGRSGWGLIIVIGIIAIYGIQFLAVGVVLLFNHNIFMIDEPSLNIMMDVLSTILAVYAIADVALFGLSAWRIQRAAEVE